MNMRVMFVDDEAMLLSGLRRMLTGQPGWELLFAEGGREALRMLAEHPVDIVVADMRMPGMDGAQLLSTVQERFPGIARIVFSGHSDRDMVMRLVKSAHQFLSKPSDKETIVAVLERVHTLRDIFTNTRLRDIITKIDSLPILPNVYLLMVEELEREDCSLDRAGRILSADVGLTAGILKTVNSAFFGLPRKITSPEQAAALLGVDVLKGLVISQAMFGAFDQNRYAGFHLDLLWAHCIRVASFARSLSVMEYGERGADDLAFLGGLLHDLGKLALADRLPDEFGEILRLAQTENITFEQAETKVLAAGHAELGAYLLGLWGFPEELVKAVAVHHRPAASPDGQLPLAIVTHVANYLDHLLVQHNKEYADHPIDAEHIIKMGLLEKLPVWVEICHNLLDEADA